MSAKAMNEDDAADQVTIGSKALGLILTLL